MRSFLYNEKSALILITSSTFMYLTFLITSTFSFLRNFHTCSTHSQPAPFILISCCLKYKETITLVVTLNSTDFSEPHQPSPTRAEHASRLLAPQTVWCDSVTTKTHKHSYKTKLTYFFLFLSLFPFLASASYNNNNNKNNQNTPKQPSNDTRSLTTTTIAAQNVTCFTTTTLPSRVNLLGLSSRLALFAGPVRWISNFNACYDDHLYGCCLKNFDSFSVSFLIIINPQRPTNQKKGGLLV